MLRKIHRYFGTIASRDIIKGTVLKRNDHYMEVVSTNWIPCRDGQGMHLELLDVQTHKRSKLHLGLKDTAEEVSLDSYPVEIESLDLSNQTLNVSDTRHNIVKIPLAFAQWAKSGVKPGTLLNMVLHGETFIKLSKPFK